MNVPNFLTFLRIMAVPVFFGLLTSGRKDVAFYLFGTAALTDALDGVLAKSLNQRSALGTLMDPVADKLLLGGAFLGLMMQKTIPLWLGILVVGRDFILVLGFLLLRLCSYRPKVQPTLWGKLTTLSQSLFVLSILAPSEISLFSLLRSYLTIAVVSLTFISGTQYILKGIKIPRGGAYVDYSEGNSP